VHERHYRHRLRRSGRPHLLHNRASSGGCPRPHRTKTPSAVLREIREETGVTAEVILRPHLALRLPARCSPYTILLEDSPEPGEPHQHIDLIYFCRLADEAAHDPPTGDLHWVDGAALRANQPLDIASGGVAVPIAEDVRLLAINAIETARLHP
jgi:8-oxo-dGTP pyrophosphatase MutT (NUDIX family)